MTEKISRSELSMILWNEAWVADYALALNYKSKIFL